MRRVWGMNNREAPLRMCTDSHGEPNNMEYKALDATANPYLALAVLIIAGLEACFPCRLMHVPDLTHICKCPPLDVTLQCGVSCAGVRAATHRQRSVHQSMAGRALCMRFAAASGGARNSISSLLLLQGINQHRQLPEPTLVDPHSLEEGERKQQGIKLLSTNLLQALNSFTADQGAHL